MNSDRVGRVREKLAENKIDALIVTAIDNVRWLSGFTGSTAAAVVSEDRAVVLVDPRYTIQASKETEGVEVREFSLTSLLNAVAGLVGELAVSRVGFEADDVTVADHKTLKKALSGSPVKLAATTDIIAALRLVKDKDEVARIIKAAGIADKCFEHIVSFMKPGMKEREVALEIDTFMRSIGADAPAFDTIVAAGPNSALPHARPGEARLKTGQFVKMDYGANYKQYNSDITRTIALGKASAKMKEVYGIVLEAQLAAIDAIKPGRAGKEIDAVARNLIAERGYGDNFGHGLGHSLGRAVHDGQGFSRMSKVVLQPGMVMTVEPGIYLEGWGGVRIEDDVVVTEKGCEILTHATKELIVI